MNNNQILNERKSNFELLRIICMFMIVIHHFAVHSGFSFSNTNLYMNEFWIQFIQLGGKIGVDVFMLISGYFLVSSKKFKISRIAKIIGVTTVYSVIIYLVLCIIGNLEFGIKQFVVSTLPLIFDTWWFASGYFIVYLFSPFINILLNTIDKNTYKKLLILMLICWCIIPTITGQDFRGNATIWLLCLYFVAGYIKLHGNDWKITAKKCSVIVILLVVATYLSAVVFDIIGIKSAAVHAHATFFYNMQRLPIFLISVFMFIGFKNIDIKNNKFINMVSSTTFGIYLLHDNHYMRPIIWKKIFNSTNYVTSSLLPVYSIITSCIVFLVCSLIDIIRIKFIEKPFITVISNNEEKILNSLNKILDYKWLKKYNI